MPRRDTQCCAPHRLGEALKARYEGDFNYEPCDRLLKVQLTALDQSRTATFVGALNPLLARSSVVATPAPSAEPLSVVGATFRTTQIATETWDKQTAAQAGATFRLFVDVCGDRPLAAYTRKDAGRFRDQSSGYRTITASIHATAASPSRRS